MNHPEKEIIDVVKQITIAKSPDEQKSAFERYFIKEAAFNHPLVKVLPGKDSRNAILGIYQWYRNLSPHLRLEVEEVVYDADKLKMYLRIAQRFHMFFSPLPVATARLVTELFLVKDGDLYYVKEQDDYYHPEEFLNLLVPPLAVILTVLKYFGTIGCLIFTWIFQSAGYWKPNN